MTTKQNKTHINVKLAPDAAKLLRRAERLTRLSRTRIIEDCVRAHLWPKESKVPCPPLFKGALPEGGEQ